MNYLRMDLKVCEGCGALWLRVSATKGVYCRGCSAMFAEFPAARERRSAGKRKSLKRTTGCGAASPRVGGTR